MTAIEHKELKGITIKNLLVTIISTASIVASVITSYLQLKSDIHDVKIIQETQTRIDDIRLKVLETQVSVLQQQVGEMKPHADNKQSKTFSTINKSLIQ
jgi:hypothetical protein